MSLSLMKESFEAQYNDLFIFPKRPNIDPPTPSNHWREPVVRKDGSTLRSQTRKLFGGEGLASADFAEEIKRNHERELVELHFVPLIVKRPIINRVN